VTDLIAKAPTTKTTTIFSNVDKEMQCNNSKPLCTDGSLCFAKATVNQHEVFVNWQSLKAFFFTVVCANE
jgi:hypothetical protein